MDWWHEDPELLSATLYMLTQDEENAKDASALSSASSSDAHGPSAIDLFVVGGARASRRTKRAPRTINMSRERRRDEARMLRDTAVELEGQLEKLKQRRQELLKAHKGDAGEIRSIAVVWEDVATRQFRERRRAEMMNMKLRSILEMQNRVARDLIASIQRAEELNRQHEAETDGYVSTSIQLRLPTEISRKVSEEEQLRRLGLLFLQWEEAFTRSSKFNDGKSVRFLDLQLLADDGVDAVVDVFVSWALPFPRALVEENMWRYFLNDYTESQDHSYLQAIESRNNVHTGVFQAASIVDGHRVSFDGKLVARHFRNPKGHLVLVIQTHTEPRCESKFLENVVVEEDTWVRIADAHDLGGPELACPLTVVQHVRRFHIHFKNSSTQPQISTRQATQRGMGALTEFLMQQTKQEVIKGEQIVENLLLNSEPIILSE